MLESFLGAFIVAAILCAILCALGLSLFSWFRSGERKEGNFKADQSTGGFRFDPKKKELKKQPFKVSASELPLVGGPALIFATMAASLAFAFLLGLDTPEWLLLGRFPGVHSGGGCRMCARASRKSQLVELREGRNSFHGMRNLRIRTLSV